MDVNLSPNHASCRLYYGVPKTAIPDYLHQRLRNFFSNAEALHLNEVRRGIIPHWIVAIDPRRNSSPGPAYEWVDVMVEHEVDPDRTSTFYPEQYGYCDGLVAYEVRVLTRRERVTDYAKAAELFAFLRRDEHLFATGDREEMAHMASYSIERIYRRL